MKKQLQQLSVNGIELHYQKSGSGKPLIFVPGSISDYRTWAEVTPHFEQQFECYAISRRYCFPGKYPPGGDGSVAVNTEDLAQFIRVLNLVPVRVVGHSYGGYAALSLAIRHPELVEKVVAEEPIFAPALVKNPKNPLQIIGFLLRNFRAGKSFARLGMKGIDPTFKSLATGDLVTAQKTFTDGVTDGKKTPETLDSVTRQQLADNIAALTGEDPFKNNLTMDDARKIQCPVLFVSGTESPYVFQYINERLHGCLSQSSLKVVSGADHWVHMGKRAEFVEALRAFL